MSARGRFARVMCVIVPGIANACGEPRDLQRVTQAFHTGAIHPDESPRLVTSALPFRYPAAMYARRVQGNVTLRLFVDRDGMVRRDSTRVEESSGYAALDSAAIRGAVDLRFIPAKLNGEPLGVIVLFPVYFRHPEARALPGDTILNMRRPTP